MNAPTTEKSLSVEAIVEAEISSLVTQLAQQESPKVPTQSTHAERIKHAVGRLTSSSINELKGLTSELEGLQDFLKSEVERVERDIQSALDGINIIIETIAPWRSDAESPAAPSSTRAVRGGPAANITSAPRVTE